MSDKKLRLDAVKIAISRESASDSATPALKIYFFLTDFHNLKAPDQLGLGRGPVTLAHLRQPRNAPPSKWRWRKRGR